MKDIDLLIQIAPRDGVAGKVTIGNYRLLNNRAVLTAFKKRRAHCPRRIGAPTPPTRPQNKRIVGFDGDYSIPYVPCKSARLYETDGPRVCYVNGFYTNTYYAVKIPRPEIKRKIETESVGISDFIAKALEQLSPVTIGKVEYHGGETVIVNIGTVAVNAFYVDVIFKYYPDAKPYIKNGAIFFLSDGAFIGAVQQIIS